MLGMKKFNKKDFLENAEFEDHSVYLIEVAYDEDNCIHRAILFTGFRRTGGYFEIYGSGDSINLLYKVYYMKILRQLVNEKEMKTISVGEV